jgi:tetratricopeptide (TPR) repeat protein
MLGIDLEPERIVWALILLSWFIRSFTTLFHELGHAIPALMYTEGDVVMYVGSYEDMRYALQLRFGRLFIVIKPNILAWNGGVCSHGEVKGGLRKQMLVILGGPMASLIFSAIFVTLVYVLDAHDFWKLFSLCFTIASMVDLAVNLYPSPNPIVLPDGKIMYNDGFQLRQLRLYGNKSEDYRNGVDAMANGNNVEAIKCFKKALEEHPRFKEGYRKLIQAHLKERAYADALNVVNSMQEKLKLSSTDLSTAGWVYMYAKEHEKAAQYFSKAHDKDMGNSAALLYRAFNYLVMRSFRESVIDCNLILTSNPNHAIALSIRATAKILGGAMESGYEDLMLANEIHEDNAHVQRAMGIYEREENHLFKAKEHFYRARELDPLLFGIDELVEQLDKRLDVLGFR